MIMAWTRLLHAFFNSTIGDRYYYKEKRQIRTCRRRTEILGHGHFFADALKADRNHRITFARLVLNEIVRAISFYAGQISVNAGTHKGG